MELIRKMNHFYFLFCILFLIIQFPLNAHKSESSSKNYGIETGYKVLFLGSSFSGRKEREFETEYAAFGKYITEKYKIFAGLSYISHSRKPSFANGFFEPYAFYHLNLNYDTFQNKRFDVPIYAYTGFNYEIKEKYYIKYFGLKLGRFPGESFESWQGSPFSLLSPMSLLGDKTNSCQNYERKIHRQYSALGVLELHGGWNFHIFEKLSLAVDLAVLFTSPNRKTAADTYIDLNRLDGGDPVQLILLNKFMNGSKETGGSIGQSFSLGLHYIY
ncbi:MAG TPA: hypothetical protein PL048_07715 [Leptospiraceae bacterium]|nr:hypothetical protein [Leptospiraceae bacterium]HMZ58647.1 hypothetical protein [Leptospiraceae bacterium]HNF12517.1 hypothetical protein [Leptospiraceae bacterium]HNF24192.1 hypothetical protein [Leptospiraceae bacterium]HNN02496.1 hypothetical protein [Leptospiraceae bacterium]